MARKSSNPHEAIIRNLNALSRGELEELQALIGEKLATMRATSGLLVDMFDDESKAQPEAKQNQWIEWKMINGCGPYAYLRYRDEAGRMRSKYLKGHKVDQPQPATKENK